MFSPQIIHKWKTSPLLVSFDSTVTPIWNIPFPAVTICNMNRVLASRVEYVEKKYKETNGKVRKWKNEHYFIEEVCHIEDETSPTLDLTGEEVHEYLAALAQPCDQMLLRLSQLQFCIFLFLYLP